MTSIETPRGVAGDAVLAAAAEALRTHIRDIHDFPQPGVVFKDITPLLATPAAFSTVVGALSDTAEQLGATVVAGIEARGFLLAAPVADRIGAGIVPIRKQGKLPGRTVAESYALEYGTATLEIHDDAVGPGDRVLIVDDVLATGGTAAAASNLLRHGGAEVLGLAVLMELTFLAGRDRIPSLAVTALLEI
ncbi:adenine phosphoribosyltransferase [Frankia sp. CNm7]|uniref:Adenine phosphoribosyltransferase n=1 Tax=Frankia nepalensis TaxID=1836974 RepID=A0A937RNY7_9ACTN|nr:adenine phosphoribosyltransferase [Frankia nepalensis]MBL7494748.1 adenine phosphoribosyltransferase [Frankia nepalensis]MBL7514031.1 adenine phosphoribosyltransferase [Frankia nepalensis]MBL7518905.1 adenine phosphoribosyltransferase [Frankia nepalensis]MBL7629963.1 adenine phosphoribosyltransferase [Frankia nepalensis]